jgi:NitT/TauT family transport system substrate-binding protein
MQKDAWRLVTRPTRRQFVQGIAGLGLSIGGLALLAGCSSLGRPAAPAAPVRPDTPLETTTLRFANNSAICIAPEFVAEDLLRAKGFSDVQYVDIPGIPWPAIATGEVDMALATVGIPIVQADTADTVVILAGMHVGCFELFANPSVRSISDLKGKRVAVTSQGSGRHVHLAAMSAYVGVDPNRDVNWVFDGPSDAIRQFSAGQVDAFMAFPPEPQELRANGIGHVIVNTHTDRPWSQYFCCVLLGNRAFVQQHPVATRRAVRSLLEAADVCANEPERAARGMVDRGFASDYGHVLQTLKALPYNRWREYDPEDTVRFYALRLQEVGMIKSSPDAIIQKGTDWRFLNELKQELKA